MNGFFSLFPKTVRSIVEAIKKIAKNDFVEVFLAAFKAGLEAKPKK
ncbi:MAG: hypothetical protein ACKPCM_06115 [Pseudanabaena sp.]